MCGICGIVSFGGQPDTGLVSAMMDQLRHRGPDGSGLLVDDGAVLGHVRLALIDQAGGGQPLASADRDLWVTFNGEIFNFVELRAQLIDLGHRFLTRSDTEVIVNAYKQWGVACFDRFNGQWAIGMWDRGKGRLTLSRDRLGVRPLYYRLDGQSISFASEVKALFQDPRVSRELDPVGLDETLTVWSPVAPRTQFLGISQLPPGHFASFDASGFVMKPYWEPHFPERGLEPQQDFRANADRLRELIVNATRLRFERSDFPVGAYLSGGLDSAVTTAAIRAFTSASLDTFSIRFTDAAFDEGGYQAEMVQRLGTQHHEVAVTHREIADVFPEVVAHAEGTLLRTAPAPMFLLSRLVRQSGYKVVVTGEGADEVLGGYDIFREAKLREFWARDPASALRRRGAELLYPWMQVNPGKAPAFARAFFGQDLELGDPGMSHRTRWNTTGQLRHLLHDDYRAGAATDQAEGMPANGTGWDLLSRAQWLEMSTLLPGYILSSQGDRMLMANSVEGRFPFLDAEVVAFANQLPARHKLLGLTEKFLLKVAFGDLIPRSILERPKQPYRAPDAAAFFAGDSSPEWFQEVMSPSAVRRAGIFQPEQTASLIQKARLRSASFGNSDNMRLVAVASTQLLHNEFIVRAPASVLPSTYEPPNYTDLTDLERV